MAKSKVDEHELLDRLTQVFRTYGFEGASLSRISEATGLQRASLYHRFPGGKKEMVETVLTRAAGWLNEHAFAHLSGSAEPATKLKRLTSGLREFYSSGEDSCLIDALSFSDASESARELVGAALDGWVTQLSAVARQVGLTNAEATRWGEDTAIRVHGALVFARATGKTKVFERVLREIPKSLLGEEG